MGVLTPPPDHRLVSCSWRPTAVQSAAALPGTLQCRPTASPDHPHRRPSVRYARHGARSGPGSPAPSRPWLSRPTAAGSPSSRPTYRICRGFPTAPSSGRQVDRPASPSLGPMVGSWPIGVRVTVGGSSWPNCPRTSRSPSSLLKTNASTSMALSICGASSAPPGRTCAPGERSRAARPCPSSSHARCSSPPTRRSSARSKRRCSPHAWRTCSARTRSSTSI